MKDETVRLHTFIVNRENNGGEQFSVTTDIRKNEHNEVYYNQEITLMSYGNSASINLFGATFTPDLLRKWANELEAELLIAKHTS